jgi:hypothetical protein
VPAGRRCCACLDLRPCTLYLCPSHCIAGFGQAIVSAGSELRRVRGVIRMLVRGRHWPREEWVRFRVEGCPNAERVRRKDRQQCQQSVARPELQKGLCRLCGWQLPGGLSKALRTRASNHPPDERVGLESRDPSDAESPRGCRPRGWRPLSDTVHEEPIAN